MEATRRILKVTCRRRHLPILGEIHYTEDIQYHVQARNLVNLDWATETYSPNINDDREPAIFYSEEEALAFANGEFGKIKKEVIWTNEQ